MPASSSRNKGPRRPSDRKATVGQKAYAKSLAYESGSAADIIKAESKYLTHAECAEMIPRLKKIVEANRAESVANEDWTTPEGYDDSPDQGVHRYDGGGAW